MRHRLKRKVKVFQIVGSIDWVVPPLDRVDQIGAMSMEYHLLQMPKTNHTQSVLLSPKTDKDATPEIFRERKKVLMYAFQGTLSDLVKKHHVIDRKYVGNDVTDEPDNNVKDVVFVIHGIRDFGFWTSKIATRVKALADKNLPVMTLTRGWSLLRPRMDISPCCRLFSHGCAAKKWNG